MPTKRGWGVLIASGGIFALGRLLGITELYQLGVMLVSVLVIAIISAISARPRVSIGRTIGKPRVVAGEVLALELKVSNPGKRTSPMLLYTERVPKEMGGDVTLAVLPLKPGKTRLLRLQIRPRQRGAYHLGPGTLSKTDPFGLASWRHASIGAKRVLVYPSFEDLEDIALPGDLVPSRSRRKFSHFSTGDEFYALRQFQEGDDGRKIHWPSTARLGTTMVRQEERSGHFNINILLDPSNTNAEQYEGCVSSAASVLRCFMKRGHPTSMAIGPRFHAPAVGEEPYHLMMEELATSCDLLEPETSQMWTRLGAGFNVIICSRPHPEVIRRISTDRRLARRTVLIVQRESNSRSADAAIEICRKSGSSILEINREGDLSASWKRLRDPRMSAPGGGP